jgi:NADH-quinone oxidoreductase subunit C
LSITERVQGDEAVARVRDALGSLATDVKPNATHVDVWTTTENYVDVVTKLRDADGLRCKFFTFLSAIDWSEYPVEEGEETGELELIVHLYSPEHTTHVTIRVPLSFGATCPSITDVFGGALWHERECWEMFGIVFEGHPRLVGLYLPEDFEGHPGLKSFKLPTRTLVKDWPGAKDPDEAAAGGR